MENQEVASDQLTIEGYEGYGAQDYTLAACQPAFNSALRDGSATASTSRSASETPWWTGDEPLYYIVSPKVRLWIRLHMLMMLGQRQEGWEGWPGVGQDCPGFIVAMTGPLMAA